MLKILQIIPALNKGGAERLVLDLCNELQKQSSIIVKVICFRKDNAYEFLSNTIDYEVIPSSVIPSITGKPTINVRKLQHFINKFKPDIVHSHLFESEMVLSEINYPHAKYFSHFHDNMVQLSKPRIISFNIKAQIIKRFERKIILKSYKSKDTNFICISKDTQKFAIENLPSFFKSHLLHNAIDVKRFANSTKKPNVNSLTMIGSFVEKKGQNLAIETLAELKIRGLEFELNLLGDGPLLKSLRNTARELNLQEVTHFHGNVDHPETFLAESLIYLHTASYEPFGLVLLEAMAAGLPIVCSDGFGNRDLIEDGKNGFMVSDRDPKLLADKIEIIFNDPKLYETMSTYAKSFSEKFDIANYANSLLKIYRSS